MVSMIHLRNPNWYTFLGGQGKLHPPQTLGASGKNSSEKGGILFGRSESFKINDHLGKSNKIIFWYICFILFLRLTMNMYELKWVDPG